jgi:hypothetical protein
MTEFFIFACAFVAGAVLGYTTARNAIYGRSAIYNAMNRKFTEAIDVFDAASRAFRSGDTAEHARLVVLANKLTIEHRALANLILKEDD